MGIYRDRVPLSFQQETVVPGERTLVTPRLTPERVFQRLTESVHEHAYEHYGAMYSSDLGGIVDHPGLMVLHMDDHMVHHGHGVYETIVVCEGYVYQLDDHLSRLKASAAMVGLDVPVSDGQLKRIVLDTAAAAGRLNAIIKIWVTPGRGGFGVSDRECDSPALYALVSSDGPAILTNRHLGWRVTPSPVEPPTEYQANMKSTSALQHVLCQLEAEARGFQAGVFVSEDGVVLDGPNFSIAIITQDHKFIYSAPEGRSPGLTALTLAGIAPEFVDPEDMPIESFEGRPITVDDITGALEVMAISTNLGVIPITHWGETPIADGTAGYIAMALNAVLENDRVPEEGSPRHLPVPYGYLTGMMSQLV